MKKGALTLTSAALWILTASSSSAQLAVTLGSHNLQPNTTGQTLDLFVVNQGGTDVEVFGLNLAMQIGDGTAGPQVTDVSLFAGNSVFSAFSANQVDQGGSARTLFFGIDAGSGSVTIPASSTTVFGRFVFDTTGLSSGGSPWSFTLEGVGPLSTDTEYVLVGGATLPISTSPGSLTVVPEPTSTLITAGLLSVSALVLRRKWAKGNKLPA